MIDRKIAPAIHIPEKINYQTPAQHTFSNGVKLHTICAGEQDVMRFVMLFEAGTRFQTQAFVASTTANMLNEGTKNRSSVDIAELFDFYGSSFEVSVDRDWTIVSVYCLTKYCDDTLRLVEEIIKYPVFPEREFDIFKQKQQENLKIQQEKVDFLSRQNFFEVLYGAQHPYGAYGTMADYDLLKREHLLDFHNKYFTSANVFLMMAGKVGEKEEQIVQKYFGKDKWGNHTAITDRWYEVQPRIEDLFVDKDKALQSAIRVGKILFTKNNLDYIGMQVLNTVLGGYFGSRLMKNIREDKGYTYGIYSMLVPLQKSGYFSIATETGCEYTTHVIAEIKHEINVLCCEPVGQDELNLVKQYIYGDMLRSLDGPWGQSEVFMDILQSNLPLNYVDLFFNEVKAIASAQLQSLAQRYLQFESMSEVVVGKK